MPIEKDKRMGAFSRNSYGSANSPDKNDQRTDSLKLNLLEVPINMSRNSARDLKSQSLQHEATAQLENAPDP